jgi:hypothetical protein
MKTRQFVMVLLAGSFSFAGLSAAFGQNNPPAPAAPAGAGLQVLDFRPGFDDLMTMLVQPRHIKLYYAAMEKNWELAAFESNELRASFRRSGQTIPVYRTQDVPKAVAAMLTPVLDRVDKAIAAKDTALFMKEYEALTDACNACHSTMEHAFLIMRVPEANDNSRYPDQDFKPISR